MVAAVHPGFSPYITSSMTSFYELIMQHQTGWGVGGGGGRSEIKLNCAAFL